jgi:hypothetical protein
MKNSKFLQGLSNLVANNSNINELLEVGRYGFVYYWLERKNLKSELVKLLKLALETKIDENNIDEASAIFQLFVKFGKISEMQNILKSFNDKEIKEKIIHYDEDIAFTLASAFGHIKVMEFLIELTTDKELRSKMIFANGNQPFIQAAGRGEIESLKFLLEQVKDSKEDTELLIHGPLEDDNKRIDPTLFDEAFDEALEYGHLEVLKFILSITSDKGRKDQLIEHGVINALSPAFSTTESDDNTSIKKHKHEAFKYLLNLLKNQIEDQMQTLAEAAIIAVRENNLDEMKYILEFASNKEQEAKIIQIIINKAFSIANIETMEFLLDIEKDKDAKQKLLKTALENFSSRVNNYYIVNDEKKIQEENTIRKTELEYLCNLFKDEPELITKALIKNIIDSKYHSCIEEKKLYIFAAPNKSAQYSIIEEACKSNTLFINSSDAYKNRDSKSQTIVQKDFIDFLVDILKDNKELLTEVFNKALGSFSRVSSIGMVEYILKLAPSESRLQIIEEASLNALNTADTRMANFWLDLQKDDEKKIEMIKNALENFSSRLNVHHSDQTKKQEETNKRKAELEFLCSFLKSESEFIEKALIKNIKNSNSFQTLEEKKLYIFAAPNKSAQYSIIEEACKSNTLFTYSFYGINSQLETAARKEFVKNLMELTKDKQELQIQILTKAIEYYTDSGSIEMVKFTLELAPNKNIVQQMIEDVSLNALNRADIKMMSFWLELQKDDDKKVEMVKGALENVSSRMNTHYGDKKQQEIYSKRKAELEFLFKFLENEPEFIESFLISEMKKQSSLDMHSINDIIFYLSLSFSKDIQNALVEAVCDSNYIFISSGSYSNTYYHYSYDTHDHKNQSNIDNAKILVNHLLKIVNSDVALQTKILSKAIKTIAKTEYAEYVKYFLELAPNEQSKETIICANFEAFSKIIATGNIDDIKYLLSLVKDQSQNMALIKHGFIKASDNLVDGAFTFQNKIPEIDPLKYLIKLVKDEKDLIEMITMEYQSLIISRDIKKIKYLLDFVSNENAKEAIICSKYTVFNGIVSLGDIEASKYLLSLVKNNSKKQILIQQGFLYASLNLVNGAFSVQNEILEIDPLKYLINLVEDEKDLIEMITIAFRNIIYKLDIKNLQYLLDLAPNEKAIDYIIYQNNVYLCRSMLTKDNLESVQKLFDKVKNEQQKIDIINNISDYILSISQTNLFDSVEWAISNAVNEDNAKKRIHDSAKAIIEDKNIQLNIKKLLATQAPFLEYSISEEKLSISPYLKINLGSLKKLAKICKDIFKPNITEETDFTPFFDAPELLITIFSFLSGGSSQQIEAAIHALQYAENKDMKSFSGFIKYYEQELGLEQSSSEEVQIVEIDIIGDNN